MNKVEWGERIKKEKENSEKEKKPENEKENVMKIKSQCCCDQKREQIKGKSGAVAARLENFFHDDDCDCDDRDDRDDRDDGCKW